MTSASVLDDVALDSFPLSNSLSQFDPCLNFFKFNFTVLNSYHFIACFVCLFVFYFLIIIFVCLFVF